MDMNGWQRIEDSREKVYAAFNDADILRQCVPMEKRDWLGKISGVLGVVVLGLVIGAHWCCIGGHVHAQNDPLMGPICSSQL